MFERFTERARQVVVLAQDEARLLRHGYIGTEHLLLGLLREQEGLAFHVLHTFDVTVEEVRAQVARLTAHLQGDEDIAGEIPFTPGAKKALELALRETLSLGHNYISTEHILLGLVRENDGVAARILLDFDADAETIHREVTGMLSGPGGRTTTVPRGQPGGEGGAPWIRRLRIACPFCATPIETLTTDQRNTSFHVSMEGDHTCPGCHTQWRIYTTATWSDPSPPTHPEDDLPSTVSFWHHTKPAHFSMTCFRCDHDLERITLDHPTPPLKVAAEAERTCLGCGKQWRISYTVSWERLPEQNG